MKKNLRHYLLTALCGLLVLFASQKTQAQIKVCVCDSPACTYVITVNIEACQIAFPHGCIALTPKTETIGPDTCYSFNFRTPTGYALNYSTASFSVSNTGNAKTWTFGTSSSYGIGNCSSTTLGTTIWTANSLTSYMICPHDSTADSLHIPIRLNNTSQSNRFDVFPNPSSGNVNIVVSSVKTNPIAHFYNMLGQEVETLKLNSTQTIINKGTLKSGIYFYRIVDDTGIMGSGKLIIQN